MPPESGEKRLGGSEGDALAGGDGQEEARVHAGMDTSGVPLGGSMSAGTSMGETGQ